MQQRMQNPAMVLPGAMEALQALQTATYQGGVPSSILGLVHLRASQINGCHACMEFGICHIRKAGETDDRISRLASWRDTSYFTDAERAALALTEAVTRLSDQPDPVPDDIWEEATRHYDEPALASLVLTIALTNLYNRLNVTVRQETIPLPK